MKSGKNFYQVFILLGFFLYPSSLYAMKNDSVVLLHGIARSSSSMEKLSGQLEKQGYKVLNIDYPSTRLSLGELTENINSQIKKFNDDKNRKLNFVTHSMGGILVRSLIKYNRPKNLGRVVMLAPPNLGSEAADFWKENWIYQMIYGPAGQQLTTDQSAIKEFLDPIDFELGIIAGDRSIDPLHSLIIPGKDDGKVAVAKTKIKGMKDHIVIHATHTFIMNNSIALKQILFFFENGRFEKPNK